MIPGLLSIVGSLLLIVEAFPWIQRKVKIV